MPPIAVVRELISEKTRSGLRAQWNSCASLSCTSLSQTSMESCSLVGYVNGKKVKRGTLTDGREREREGERERERER